MLRPGGLALIAFHVDDADTPAGGEASLSSWWVEPVALTFRFLEPSEELAMLVTAGFTRVARLDRAPGPGEPASRRLYLLVQRPPADAAVSDHGVSPAAVPRRSRGWDRTRG